MSKMDEQIARMMGLMTYGMTNESKTPKEIEYSIDAADGKTYSVIRENSKYYIKTAPKGKGMVLESYSFIGGWNNHKDYEYDSYNNALKQLELKVRSVNEAFGDNSKVEVLNPSKKEDILAEASESMKKELSRYRELMNNVSSIMNESSISVNNTGVPESPKTTAFNSKLGEPFNQTASAELDTDLKKTANSPEKQGEPFGDNSKAEKETDAQYVPDNSVANKKPSGGKVVKVNEEFEETFENCDCEDGCCNKELDEDEFNDEEDNLPVGFGEDDDTLPESDDELETSETIDDEDFDFDDEIDLDDEPSDDEIDDEEGDEPSDDEIDDEEGDEDFEDELSALRAEIEELRAELEELKGEDSDEDSDEDFDDEDDEFDLDDDSDDDDFDSDEDFDLDDDSNDSDDDDSMKESVKKNILNKIVENVVRNITEDTPRIDISNMKVPTSNTLNASIGKSSDEMITSFKQLLDKSERKYSDKENEKMPKNIDDRVFTLSDFGDGTYLDVTPGQTIDNDVFNKILSDLEVTEQDDNLLQVGGKFESSDMQGNDIYKTFVNDNGNWRYIGYCRQGETQPKVNDSDEWSDKFRTREHGKVITKTVGHYAKINTAEKKKLIDAFNDIITLYKELEERTQNGENDESIEMLKSSIVDRTDKAINMVDKFNRIREAKGMPELSNKFTDYFEQISDIILDVANDSGIDADSSFENTDDISDDDNKAPARSRVKDAFNYDSLNDYDYPDFDKFSKMKNALENDIDDDEEAYKNAENFKESRRRNGRRLNEDGTVLHDFGKHPGYRKKPMSLPQTGSDTEGQNRDWNDDSVYSEQPFGERIGTSDPFEDVVRKTVETVMEQLKKKL